nr:MYXO-CTERM sorting domain-containing protein [Nannocystis pusilla]
MEPPAFTLPAITSLPPTSAEVGAEVQYLPIGAGDPPYWWSLADGPLGLEVDPATGALAWTPSAPGPVAFSLVLENDLGRAAQDFVVDVLPVPSDTSTETGPEDPTTGDAPTTGGPAPETSGESETSGEPDTTGTSAGPDDTASSTGGAVGEDGCGCRSDGGAGWSAALLLLGLRRRRR